MTFSVQPLGTVVVPTKPAVARSDGWRKRIEVLLQDETLVVPAPVPVNMQLRPSEEDPVFLAIANCVAPLPGKLKAPEVAAFEAVHKK
jgi:hypothetical protein